MHPTDSQKSGDEPEAAPGLLFRERADSLTRRGAKTALQHLRQTLSNSQKKGDRDAIAWTLLNIAMVLRGQREYPAVIKILEEVRGIFTSLANDTGLAFVYEELSFVNRELHRNALALEYARKAVELFQTQGRPIELAWAYDNLSVIHFNRFQRHESLVYAKRARSIFRESNSRNGRAWNACNLAKVYLEMGFLLSAARLYTEAHDNFMRLDSKQGKAWSLYGLASVRRVQCDFKGSEQLFEKARVLFGGLELKDRAGLCLLNIAAIRRIIGEQEKAVALNKKAIQFLGPLRHHDGVAWGFFQIGQIHRDRGQLVKAWQTFREALNLHTDISNRFGMGWAENEMGKTYLELSDQAHAQECFAKAKTIAEQLDATALRAEVDKNLAHLCLDGGQLQKAVELLERAESGALKINSRELEADIKLARARYWIILGGIPHARAAVDASHALIEKHGLHRLKPTLGIYLGETLMLAGKTAESIQVWQDTAQLARKLHQRRQCAEAQLGLVEAQRKSKTPAQLSLALFHIEKDVRAVGSRGLKAKFVLIKGLIQQQTTGVFDSRFVTQAAQIAGSAGLTVLERLVLEASAEAARRADLKEDLADIEQNLQALLEKGTPDLRLIRYAPERLDTFPVSVVA